jgi:hypothetical protein
LGGRNIFKELLGDMSSFTNPNSYIPYIFNNGDRLFIVGKYIGTAAVGDRTVYAVYQRPSILFRYR